MYMALLAAPLLAVALWSSTPHGLLIAWLFLFLLVQICRHVLIWSYQRATLVRKAELPWANRFAFGSGVTALLWGLTAVLLFPANSFLHQCLLAAFLGCIAASTAVIHAPMKRCYVPSVVLAVFPACGRFIYEGGELSITIGVVGIGFGLGLLGTGWSVHSMITDSIILRLRNTDLIDSLEKTRQELELRVEERTEKLEDSNERLRSEVRERKRTDEELRRLTSAVEQSTEGISLVDTAGKVIYANEAFAEMHGYSVDELMGKSTSVFYSPGQLTSVKAADRSIEETGEFSGEIRHVHRDGTEFPTLTQNSLFRDGTGDPVGTIVTIRDISGLKQTEDELRRGKETIEALLNATTDIAFMIDPTGIVIAINDRGFQFLGKARHEIVGRSILDFLPPKLAERSRKKIREVYSTGQPKRFEDEFWDTYFENSLYPVLGANGVVQIAVFARDVTDRRTAEKALRESEERYRTLINNSRTGIYIHQNGLFVYVTERLAEIMGYSEAEILGKEFWTFVDPRDRDLVRDRGMAGSIGRETPPHYEFRIICKDGTIKWVDALASGIMFQGKPANMGNLADISVRKQAEEEIRRQNAFLNNVLESLTHPFYVIDADDYMIHMANSSAVRDGIEEDTTCYSASHKRDSPCDGLEHPCPLEEVKKTGKAVVVEHVHIDTQGRPRNIEVHGYPIFDSEGNVSRIIEYCLDITKRKEAELSLQESEEKYSKLFHLSHDAVIIHDVTGAIIDANYRAQEMFGYSEREMSDLGIFDLCRAETRTDCEKHLESLGEDAHVFFETDFVSRNEGVFQAEVSAGLLDLSDTKVVQTIVRNIADRRRLEEQLHQAAKMEAIGRLAGGVAHDFNNILTAMMGYSDMLMRQIPAEGPQHDKLVQISRAAARAAELTRQLLAFSRKQLLDMKVMDLTELIIELEKMLGRLIGEDVDLKTVLSPSLGRVQADPGQVEQIIMNLAVNARDAMPQGGTLTLETADVYIDEDYARMHAEVKPGPYVMFAVSDSGVGMDGETRSRIFDPFFTTKEKGVGTGLGLSTVYGIVKQHGGHVSAYSEPNQGTTFKVYLPRVEDPSEPLAKTKPPRELPRGSETVLIVEDEEMVRDLACELLQMLGYKTLEAGDSREAQGVCHSYKDAIHILITDVVLPYMDGKSLYDALSKTRPEMKVLFVSGYTDNAIVHHGVLDRDVHFLQKPFTMESIAAKVREVLEEPVRETSPRNRYQ
jgi:two-component system, cell cycle sensor histidine kinase and response regulator CckA